MTGKHKRAATIAALLLTASVVLAPARAAAQDSEARLHDELAAELYQQRRFAAALEHLLASNRLVPSASVVANIADVYRLMERPIEAYNWYETYLADFELSADDRQRGVTARDALASRVAVIDVRATPESAGRAEIVMDRDDLGTVGRAPRRVAVTPGPHRVIARLAGHHEATAEVTAALGEVVAIELELRPIVGRLIVTSTPAGAAVRLGNATEPAGLTPVTVEVPAGPASVTVSLEGYIEQQRSINVVEDEETRLAIAFRRPASEVAVLSVETAPPGAVVVIDGEEAGNTPLTMNDLDPGALRLEVHATGRVSWSTETLLLEAGAATRVSVTLADPDARMWPGARWLGYGGGGLVAATGLVLGIVAFSERNAFYETDNPTREQLDRIRALSITADVLMAAGLVVAAVTLIVDLVRGRAPQSTGTVTVDR